MAAARAPRRRHGALRGPALALALALAALRARPAPGGGAWVAPGSGACRRGALGWAAAGALGWGLGTPGAAAESLYLSSSRSGRDTYFRYDADGNVADVVKADLAVRVVRPPLGPSTCYGAEDGDFLSIRYSAAYELPGTKDLLSPSEDAALDLLVSPKSGGGRWQVYDTSQQRGGVFRLPLGNNNAIAGVAETLGATASQAVPHTYTPSNKPLVLIPLCRKGDRAGIERQIQAGANVHETDIEGNTPLHVSVQAPKNEIATVQTLLEAGAHINAVNYIGAAPLHYVCLRERNHRGIANILLENGAEVDRQTLAGKSPLHFACEKLVPELVEVFCLFAANVNLQDSEGNTPMHLAMSREGGRDTVKWQILDNLLQCQAEACVPNHQGHLPLHVACRVGAIRCAQLLIERQSNVQAVTFRQETCLHFACLGNHAELTQLILGTAPHCLDALDAEGNTPLHNCAMVGGFHSAALLLRASADVNIKNNQKRTPFDIAKVQGTDLTSCHNPELVQLLKDATKGGNCRQS